MNNKNNNDGLPDLYMMSDKTVEEISECSQGLDEAAKERILKLCEKKLGILENSKGSDKSEKEAEVKKYTAPKWHRTAFAAAACLLIVTGLVLIKNNIKTPDPDTKNPVVTSQREETTETSVSQTEQTDKTDTYDADKYRAITEEMALKYEEVQDVMTDNGQKPAIVDYSDGFYISEKLYCKVSDPRFSNKQDIYEFVESVLTKENIEKNYRTDIESVFLEKDEKLYILKEKIEKMWIFYGWSDIPAEISDYGEDTFTAVKKYKMGDEQTGTIKFNFIKENDEWKITEVSLNSESQSELADYEFNLNVEKISAQDIYECSQPFKMPETINGCSYHVEEIYDKEKVYVALFLESGGQQVGLYDFQNNSYSEIVNIEEGDMINEYSDNYFIIEHNQQSEHSIIYYEIENKISKVIYEDEDRCYIRGTLMYNNALYFGVLTMNEDLRGKDNFIYKYDFSNDEFMMICENAIRPLLINTSVAAVIINPETGKGNAIQTIEGSENLNYYIEDYASDVCSVYNNIYELYQKNNGLYSIKELRSQKEILSFSIVNKSGYLIGDTNDNFLTLQAVDELLTPYVYDINENKMVEFDNVPRILYDTFVKDDYGIIHIRSYGNGTCDEIIVFQSKK